MAVRSSWRLPRTSSGSFPSSANAKATAVTTACCQMPSQESHPFHRQQCSPGALFELEHDSSKVTSITADRSIRGLSFDQPRAGSEGTSGIS
jgi:hypothetical protein